MKSWLAATLCIFVIAIPLVVYAQHLRNWFSDLLLPVRHGLHRERGIMVPMRDGTRLATDIYRPLPASVPFG